MTAIVPTQTHDILPRCYCKWYRITMPFICLYVSNILCAVHFSIILANKTQHQLPHQRQRHLLHLVPREDLRTLRPPKAPKSWLFHELVLPSVSITIAFKGFWSYHLLQRVNALFLIICLVLSLISLDCFLYWFMSHEAVTSPILSGTMLHRHLVWHWCV